MTTKYRVVAEEEFHTFIKNYPRPLDVHIARFCEPPVKQYCDFSDGKVWPEATVADIVLNSTCPYGAKFEPDTYRLWD